MFWVCFDSQTQFRGAVIYVSLHLAGDGILSEPSRKNISLMTEVWPKAHICPETPAIISMEKLNLYLPFVRRVITARWQCCGKGRCTDITAPITDQNRRKGRSVRLHGAYQTRLRQEPWCQTKVTTFRFLQWRPEMFCQLLLTQRRRQTFLQHSDVNGLTRTVKMAH